MQLLVLILGFPLTIYVVRAVIYGGIEEEAMQIVSRILFSFSLFALVHWFCSTTIPRERVYRMFFYGFLVSAAICIFCGFTGIQILEEDSIKPSRFLGLMKSTGIFRSFGEFGIMAALAWAYLMYFAKKLPPIVALVGFVMILLAIAISQSRNVYLVITVVTASAILFRSMRIPALGRVSLAAFIIFVPLIVEVSMPILRSTSLGTQLIGEGILQTNVEVRFEHIRDAQDLIVKDPVLALVGFPREEWRDQMLEKHGHAVAPHNHFVSSIIFLGIIGGSVWIFGLFIVPAVAMSEVEQQPVDQMTFVIMLGAITGLSFYEGFFSCVVILALAMTWATAWTSEYVPEFSNAEGHAMERNTLLHQAEGQI